MDGVSNVIMALLMEKVESDIVTLRRSICKQCKFKSEDFELGVLRLKGRSQCNQCGCDIKLKTMSAHESCPINKW